MNTSTSVTAHEARKGLYYALACYACWGLFPLYWYPLNQSAITADQLLAQRIVWSAVFAVLVLLVSQHKHEFGRVWHQPKLLGVLGLSALCIGVNWLVYLWAITNQQVLEASLGYFISPLFNVLLGRLVFKEQLNRWQLVAIALASVGILWLAIPAGHIPWVAILLALSFGLYGLLRKLAPVGALAGLVWETLWLLPIALAYLGWQYQHGQLIFAELSALQTSILLASGIATTVPLLFFAAGAKRISLSTLGMIQYGAPTLQMLLGLWLFGERLNLNRLIGYAWVWAGVALFLWGIYYQNQRKGKLCTPPK